MVCKKLISTSILALVVACPFSVAQAQDLHDDEIIVTARKKEEKLNEVPLQISVFDSVEIEKRDFRDLNDIAQATAGLEYENYVTAGLSTAPVIRGMSQTFTTSRIQNTAAFLDGIYLQRQSMVNPGLMETSRVEVVKGPQSAVYGRNAFSGAINYITKAPTEELEFSIGGTVGNGGRYDYRGTISGPIGGDAIRARLSYGASEFDGHTDNNHPFANDGPSDFGTNDKLGGWDDEMIAASVEISPSDRFKLGASYYRNETKREPQGMYYLTGARGFFNNPSWVGPAQQGNCLNTTTPGQLFGQPATTTGFHAFCGELPTTPPVDSILQANGFQTGQVMIDPRSFVMDAESEVFKLSADFELSETLDFSYLLGHVKHNALGYGIAQGSDSLVGAPGIIGTRVVGPPFAPVTIPVIGNQTTFNANPREDLKSTSHEVRLSYDGPNFDARFGAYYADVSDTDSGSFYFLAPCDNAATCGMSVPTSPPRLTTMPPFHIPGVGHGVDGNLANYDDKIFAIFADVNWDVSEELSLIGEARYETEKKDYEQVTATFGFPDPLVAEETFNFFTPRITAKWTPDFLNGNMVYGLIAKGVKTGGFNSVDLAINPDQLVYEEETNWTYELGSKASWLDGRITSNSAIYYIDWSNIQGTESANSPNPFATDVTGNIGDAKVWGVELDGYITFSENFGVDYAFTLLNPEYKNAFYESAQTVNQDGTPDLTSSWGCTAATPECNANGDVSGNKLERTSTKQASIGFNYQRPISISGSSTWDLSARWDFNFRNKMYATPLNLAHNGDRLVSNANLSLTNGNLSVSLWGKNIFDKEYVANSFVLPSFSRYIVGLGAERTFGMTARYDFK